MSRRVMRVSTLFVVSTLTVGLALVLDGGVQIVAADLPAPKATKPGPSDQTMFGGTPSRNMANSLDKYTL